MDAIEYLKRYGNIKNTIQRILYEIEEIEDTIGGRNIDKFDYIPSTNIYTSKTESAALELAELHTMLKEYQAQAVRVLIENYRLIEKLKDDNEKDVLFSYYIGGRNIADIADQLNQSERNISRIKKRAIKNLNDILSAEEEEQCYQ